MSTTDTPVRGSFRGLSDLPLIGRQVYFEQLGFWLNPIGAIITIVFSLVFVIFFETIERHTTTGFPKGINGSQYYLPAFMAYGVMAACFNIMAITLVNRREVGLLKRLRLSPLPTWMLLAAMFLNWMIIAVIQIVLVLIVGLFYGVHGPHDIGPFILVVLVGMLSFTAMGVGISTLAPNADSAAPIVSLVFFILIAFSGLYFPIKTGSGLSNIVNFFPIRHLILATVDTFNAVPGTSPWGDLLVMGIWGVVGAWFGFRRWDWSPKRG
ncbi:MAG TPA: ABC transporter permease [Acidimicrobiales bacterium]|jgi:ABC-2 type transport system permease protein